MPHQVYFYGPIKLNTETNTLEKVLIGWEGIIQDSELSGYGERCLNSINTDGSMGETGCLHPRPQTIIPLNFSFNTTKLISLINDVFEANEIYVRADEIIIPLYQLKVNSLSFSQVNEELCSLHGDELELLKDKCCYGHFVGDLINHVLFERDYSPANDDNSYQKQYYRPNGEQLLITGIMNTL